MDINIPFYKMSKAQKTQLYMDNLTVIFNPQALFSDGTAFYRNRLSRIASKRYISVFGQGGKTLTRSY